MRKFCPEVEKDKDCCNELKEKFQECVQGYERIYNKYANHLREYLKNFYDNIEYKFYIEEDKATVGVLSTFTEGLIKIILSLYSKGPRNNLKWMDVHLTFPVLIEILNQTLQNHNEGQSLALAVLLERRYERNGMEHKLDPVNKPALIRQMNIFREMLIFIEPDLNGRLKKYEYPKAAYLDIGDLLSDDKLDPNERTLVLIAGSLHDIESDKRALLANIPWTMVIDLDAASAFGGLRSSVNDNSRIKDLKWDKNCIPKNRTYDNNITEWYNCGDLLNVEFRPEDIDDSHCCIEKRDGIVSNTDKHAVQKLFSNSIDSLKDSKYPVTFLFIHHNMRFVNNIISQCNTAFNYNSYYSFLGVYYQSINEIREISYLFDFNYPEEDIDSFNFFRCDIHSFFNELSNYKDQLPLLKSTDTYRTLPSKDGPVPIEINRYQTFADFSDVLYSDCDVCDEETVKKNKEAFYKGEQQATWSILKNSGDVVMLHEKKFNRYKEIIKKCLDKADDENKVVVYYMPGIGGSTFIRQLAYSFHKNYPVIYIQREYKKIGINNIKNELNKLYDNLKKGILVLADEMDTFDAETLRKGLASSESRPFCFLTSQRAYSSNKGNTLNSISDDNFDKLKKLYQNQSPLSSEELSNKNEKINEVLTNDMRIPFLVALYYLEKDFYGISDYVEKTLQNCESNRERKVISYAALLNLYSSGSLLPNTFAMFLSTGRSDQMYSFLKSKSYTSSILTKVSNNCITTKHYLIGEEILKQMAMKLYGMKDNSNYKMYLHSFASDFIDDYFLFLSKNKRYEENDNDILKSLFINSKEGDDKFSKLIEEVGFNNNSELILKKLVETAEKFINSHIDEDAQKRLYSGLAHFYGHLGRFYHQPGNPRKNIKESIVCAEKAVENMDKAEGNDNRIYHMCGKAYQRLLKEKLENFKYAYDNLSFEERKTEIAELEDIFSKSCDKFEATINHGGYQYGCLSELELYIDFVGEMCVDVDGQKTPFLDSKQMDIYISDIHSLFDMVSNMELDNSDRNRKNEFRSKFDSFTNNKDGVDHYQGLMDSAQANNNQETLFKARFGLLYARIKKWEKSDGKSKSEECRRIMALLDDICSQPHPENSRERFSMISAYNQWFYFARLNSKPIDEGIVKAEHWTELSEEAKQKDPRPYYNMYVLKYLEALDGYSNQIRKAEELRYDCSVIAEHPNNVFGQRFTTRDILINGRGMGQLYPCKGEERPDVSDMRKISGMFKDTKSGVGFVSVNDPSQWKDCTAKFYLTSATTLTDKFLSHNVEFYGAFTFEQLIAYNDVVADITSGENLETQYKKYFSRSNDASKPRSFNTEIRHPKVGSIKAGVIVSKNMEGIFYPNQCYYNQYQDKYYLNGTVEIGGKSESAGFPLDLLKNIDSSIEDLEEEAEKIINAKGQCGFHVKCYIRSNGRYSIDIKNSVSDYSELIETSAFDYSEQNNTAETSEPNEESVSYDEKSDYSFLKKAEGNFTPTGKQNKKTVAGRFEYKGQVYEAVLQCDGAKPCSDIIKKGKTRVIVNSTPNGRIIVKPLK